MNILSIELSSAQGSLAVLRGAEVLAQESWAESRRGGRPFFEMLQRLPIQCGLTLADFELITVGRGPGSFSGSRVALTAAQTLALADGIPLHAVSSGEALARRLGGETGRDRVAVVGDARREQLWIGQICRDAEGGWSLFQDWSLVRIDDVESMIDAGVLAASPDWSTKGDLLKAAAPDATWIERDTVPHAVDVARLALARIRAGLPSEPPVPLYLHPPVFVEPSHPAAP